MLVSLEDAQAKQLAEVLSNDTSRKIIDHLSENEDATESDVAKALNIPLPDQTQLKQQLQQALRVKIVTVVTCQNQFIDSNPDNLSQPQIDQVCLDQANQTYQNTLTQP